MGNPKRYDIFFEKHIGFGIRWNSYCYPLHLAFSFPFFTICVAIGTYNG